MKNTVKILAAVLALAVGTAGTISAVSAMEMKKDHMMMKKEKMMKKHKMKKMMKK